MKKILLGSALLIISITGFSQARFGIIGGLNLANQVISVSNAGLSASISGSSIPSFHIGGFADVPMSQNIDFMPELLLSGKGSNFNGDDGFGNTVTTKFRPYYLDIPLNVVYRAPIKKGGTFFVGAGPQFGIGLFGNVSNPDTTTEAFQTDWLKRFDFGLNFITGVELKSGVMFSINYDIGLINIADNSSSQNGSDASFMNRVFSFSVGYIFAKGRK